MRAVTLLGYLLIPMLLLWAAPSSGAELDWLAPERCPDAEELRFRVERAIGMPLSRAAARRVFVRIERRTSAYVAHMAVEAGPEAAPRERELTAAECEPLADMVTVAVALALGVAPEAAETPAEVGPGAPETAAGSSKWSEPEAPRSSLGAPRREAAADAAPSVTTEDAAASSAAWRPGASLGLVGDSGSLPSFGAGLALAARLQRARFSVRASATLFREQHEALGSAGGSTPGADLALITGALEACAVPSGDPGATLLAFGCAGWELGRLSGEGTGVAQPRRGAMLWNAPRLGAGTSLALGSNGLRLAAELTLAVPLGRQNFVLTDIGSVHRPSSAVARASIGLEWTP